MKSQFSRSDRRKLGEVAALWDSLHKTPPYLERGRPMVRVTDVRTGFLKTNDAVRVSEETFREFTKRYQPKVGDIVFSRVGSYGNSSFVATDEAFCLGQNTVCVSPHREMIDPYFLYSFLVSPDAKDQIEARVGGASQPTISLKSIALIDVPCPTMRIQRAIAQSLRAYDDLIENNTRRIAILEEIARCLYEEWFVRIRFPGSSEEKEFDPAVDDIPAGWRKGSLADIAEKRSERFVDGTHAGLPLVDLARMPRRSNALADIGAAGDITTSRTVFRKGSVLFGAIRPNFHKVVFAPFEGISNVSVHNLEPKPPYGAAFLFLTAFADSTVAWAVRHAGGMKMPTISWDVLSGMPVRLPAVNLATQFEEFVMPMLEQVSNLVRQNLNLRTTRDLLLPKLISGELDVSAMPEPEALAA